MRVVRPASVTPTTLLSSNVALNDAPVWASGTYSTGQTVLHNLHVYESVADGNTLEPGAETATPFKWIDLGACNRWQMFDKRAGQKWLLGKFTENPESIDLTIRPGQVVNAIGLVGVSGTTVRVVMSAPGEGTVYDKTVQMADTGVTNWYDYWFSPFERRDNVAMFDLPAYGNADVQVIVSAPGGTARVGTLVLGSALEIGMAVYGTGLGLVSYTRTDEDDFGNVTLTPRGSRRTVDFDLRIPTDQIGTAMRTLERLRDVPSLYVGDAGMDTTIIVGRFERLATVISNPALCDMTLEVRSFQ